MNLDNIINETINKNKLVKTKNGLLIRDYIIESLHKYGMDVFTYSSYDEILFKINDFINNTPDLLDEEYDEISAISNELAEIKYYNYTNK